MLEYVIAFTGATGATAPPVAQLPGLVAGAGLPVLLDAAAWLTARRRRAA